MEDCQTCEKFKFDFLGFKIEAANPGKISILMLIILIIFFVVALCLFKQYLLPGLITTGGGKALIKFLLAKVSALKKGNIDGP